jgi:alkanesulfonate monooxygenase SsuD/methylene tetrahydromethanopterin reductase-like flavin-dependent oxidoreductase (luciferase family)
VGIVKIGVMFRCANPPELLREFAGRVEESGYNELWVVEDCFYAGAVASAATALAATERIPIGIGVLPAVLRNPALAAMEIAALARLFPGRTQVGFGHGVAEWMRQVGAFPSSQLAALGETVRVVRALLAGEAVTFTGREVRLRDVRLEFPPEVIPPVSTGVMQEKSMRLSGEVADGTILSEHVTSPGYVSWARRMIDEGRRAAGRTDPHRLTVYSFLGALARDETALALARVLRAGHDMPTGIPADIADEVATAAAATDDDHKLASLLPDEYLGELSITGSPDRCAAGIEALHRAGADAVILVPSNDPGVADDQLRFVAREVLPLLDGLRTDP